MPEPETIPTSEQPPSQADVNHTPDASVQVRRPIPWVIFGLLGLSVSASLWAFTQHDEAYRWLYGTSHDIWTRQKWWTLITSNLLHVDLLHLCLNAYWILRLGTVLERRLHFPHFLLLIVFAGWISSTAELAWNDAMGVGLSGIVYAIFGFLMVNRRNDAEFRTALAGNVIPLFIAWFFICFALTASDVLRVANFGHLGGMVAGLLCSLAQQQQSRAVLARVGLGALGVFSIATLFWLPWSAGWLRLKAYHALCAKDYQEAKRYLEPAHQSDPKDDWTLYCLAETCFELGDYRGSKAHLVRLSEVSKNADFLNRAAWALATATVDELRDGRAALMAARSACEIVSYQTPEYLDTLAAAYAEAGDYLSAVKAVESALQHGGEHAGEYARHAAEFRAGRPWRDYGPSSAPDQR